MKNKNGTYQPDDRFEELPEELIKIKKTSTFSVPQDYFDKLPGIIQNRVSDKEQKGVRFRTILSAHAVRLIVPVIAVLLIFYAFFFVIREKPSEQESYFSGVSLEGILEDYPEFFEEMDENTLINVLITSNDDIYDPGSSLKEDTTLTKENILEYLEDEDIDTEYLYNL